jgi:predicted O-methyltransferase YrrM
MIEKIKKFSNILIPDQSVVDRVISGLSLVAEFDEENNKGLDRNRKGMFWWDMHCVLSLVGDILKPKRYLEIGVRRFAATAIILKTCCIELATCVDVWNNNYSNLPNDFESALLIVHHIKENTGVQVEAIQGKSEEVLPKFIVEKRMYDLIVVDGDHNPDSCFNDLMLSSKLLSESGVVLVDDLGNEPCYELNAVVKEFCEEELFSPIYFKLSGGMNSVAVLTKGVI